MKALTSLPELDDCLIASAEKPVLIFKHSTACPISSQAYHEVAKYIQNASESDPKVYLVKVIEARPVSNQIADELALQHKSPQLILVKDRSVLWSSSHYGINEQAIREAVTGRRHSQS
ncbi:MAG: bacillithiol system redox-active protein YtxJ [Candidatus Hydrogenedentes bacterium]|nr:bacillithiol system redox-active protein YtxJ [Candidatus Hydrogenedentota bacterium]